MSSNAFQDFYPERLSYCFGCGRKNDQGYHLKSYWDGDDTVARFRPEPYHTGGIPGNVYGGLIASLMDCHGMASAAAAAFRSEGREMGSEPAMRFVTASIKVDYLKPTPIGEELELRGEVLSTSGRKVTVRISLTANRSLCARGELVAIKLSE